MGIFGGILRALRNVAGRARAPKAAKPVKSPERAIQSAQQARKDIAAAKRSTSRNVSKTERQRESFAQRRWNASEFYAKNRDIWKNVPYAERERAIMDYYGVSNLRDAYRLTEKRFKSTNSAIEKGLREDTENWPEEQTYEEIHYRAISAAIINR